MSFFLTLSLSLRTHSCSHSVHAVRKTCSEVKGSFPPLKCSEEDVINQIMEAIVAH